MSCGDVPDTRSTTNVGGNPLKIASRAFGVGLTVPVHVVAGRTGASDSVLWVLEPIGIFIFGRGRFKSLDTSRKGIRRFEEVVRKGPPFPVVHGDGTQSFNEVWLASASGCERDKRAGVIVPYVGPRIIIGEVSSVSGKDWAIAVSVFGEPQFSTDRAQEVAV
jgi:hypothetical protein